MGGRNREKILSDTEKCNRLIFMNKSVFLIFDRCRMPSPCGSSVPRGIPVESLSSANCAATPN